MLDDATLDRLIDREAFHHETRNLKINETIHPRYLSEAIQAHRAGIARSCIIMTANAVFDDLDRKLRHLVSVNDKRRPFLQDIDRRVKEGELREMVLSTELLANELIEPEQANYLSRLRLARNDSAHPSGKIFTRSEAASLLEDGIDLVLGQESLGRAAFAEGLAQRLHASNYFSKEASAQIAVAESEVSRVVPQGYHVLVRNVTDVLMKSDNVTAVENAGVFLVACAAIDNQDLTKVIYRHLILPNLESTASADDPITRTIFNFATVAPDSLVNLNGHQRVRLDTKLAAYLNVLAPERLLIDLRILELGMRVGEAARRSKSVLPETMIVAGSSLPIALRLLEKGNLSSLARQQLLTNFTSKAANPQSKASAAFFSFVEKNAAAIADSLAADEAHRLITSIRSGRAAAEWADSIRWKDMNVRRRDWSKAYLEETKVLERLLIDKVRAWFEAEPDEANRNAHRNQLADPSCLWGPTADGIRFESVPRTSSPVSKARASSIASTKEEIQVPPRSE